MTTPCAPLLTFAHLTDTHLHPDPRFTGKRAWSPRPTAEAVIAHINALPHPVDFVLHTGDLGNDPLRAEHYITLRDSVFAKLRPPLYVIPGNHDHRVWLSAAFHPQHERPYYTFEANGVQVVCLDTSLPYLPFGDIEPEQLAWLETICAADSHQPLVLALHHHPLPLHAEAMDAIGLRGGEALHQTLLRARHRLKCVLFGHIHEGVTMVRDGIVYASTFSTWYQSKTWHGQTGDFAKADLHHPGYTVVTLTADGGVMLKPVRVIVK